VQSPAVGCATKNNWKIKMNLCQVRKSKHIIMQDLKKMVVIKSDTYVIIRLINFIKMLCSFINSITVYY